MPPPPVQSDSPGALYESGAPTIAQARTSQICQLARAGAEIQSLESLTRNEDHYRQWRIPSDAARFDGRD
jgi:hypothetical protein